MAYLTATRAQQPNKYTKTQSFYAFQYDGTLASLEEFASQARNLTVQVEITDFSEKKVYVQRKDVVIPVNVDDWVVIEENDSVRVYDNDSFESQFSPVYAVERSETFSAVQDTSYYNDEL